MAVIVGRTVVAHAYPSVASSAILPFIRTNPSLLDETLLYRVHTRGATAKCGEDSTRLSRSLIFLLFLIPAGIVGLLGAIIGVVLMYFLFPCVGLPFFFLVEDGDAFGAGGLALACGAVTGFAAGFSIVIDCCCGVPGRINHPTALGAVVLLFNLTLSQVTA
jgi:hypothetical protein